MNELIPVSCYGIHVHAGIPYLHQQKDGKGVDAIGGSTRSPFIVTHRGHPPHTIGRAPAVLAAPTSLVPPTGFLNNPLVDFYLPKPHLEGVPSIGVVRADMFEAFPILHALAGLGGATDDAVKFIHRGLTAKLESDLGLTNLIPLSVVGWKPPATDALHRLAEFALTQRRRLIVSIDTYVPAPPNTIDLTDAYRALPNPLPPGLRQIGNTFFEKYMLQLAEFYHEPTLTPDGDAD